ncbi:MAG: hypothetical protein JO125_16785 [Chloroflexi bacterium]|nr:hypothetical protein [Chloroflexota bacterium]
MTAIELETDISPLIDALVAENSDQILTVAHKLLEQGENPEVLLGRVGLAAAKGDSDGHVVITLAAAAMLSRLLHTLPQPLEGEVAPHNRALPLFVYPLLFAAPAVRVGTTIQPALPDPFYPSDLPEGKTVNDLMHDAVYGNDLIITERLLLGLYGTGADYCTMQVRTYDGISTTFQNAGHPLMFASRGFQLLDAVEWGNRAPTILHWLAPHLPLQPTAQEPDWVKVVRSFANDQAHDMTSIRKRIAAPKNENALPLRSLIQSTADTAQVCQGVYDAVMSGGASPRATGSMIALAAADVMRSVDDSERDSFIRAAHGLLFASAVRLVFQRIQDVEVLTLLFTSAAYVNALHKEVSAQGAKQPATSTASKSAIVGGGLIAVSLLEGLSAQLKAQDLTRAVATARHYLRLGHDVHALFATIALAAACNDAAADQGHTLQVVQAAAEEYLAWPTTFAQVDAEVFLRIALRAAAFGKRSTVTEHL